MTTPATTVLVVDDDPLVRTSLTSFLQLEGFATSEADSAESALAQLHERDFPLILSDMYLPGQNGLDLLRQVKAQAPDTAVILLTGFARVEDAVTGIRGGAYDYVTKPVDDAALLRTMRHALEESRLRRENSQLKRRLGDVIGFEELVGRDHQMRKLFDLAATVGDTDTTVLLGGESGTGKSSIARAMHRHSRRRKGPLVEVSCGALAPNLLESELFGHVRGAFTGAIANKVGRFQQARGGTILLDEIDTLDLALQVKLLRVLQERRFEPVGGTDTRTADVRIIAASNQDLNECMRAGTFRQDLYYRLNVISLTLPPLRDRLTDIPEFIRHFLAAFCAHHEKQLTGVDDAAVEVLVHYPWPGNIRELENVIERAVILCRTDLVTVEDLPDQIVSPPAAPPSANGPPQPLRMSMEDAERGIILRALEAQGWNRQATAAVLDINRTTLFHKMKKLDLLQPPASRRS